MKFKVNLIQVEKIEFPGREGGIVKSFKYIFLRKDEEKLLELFSPQEDGELFLDKTRTYSTDWSEGASFEIECAIKVWDGKPTYQLLLTGKTPQVKK